MKYSALKIVELVIVNLITLTRLVGALLLPLIYVKYGASICAIWTIVLFATDAIDGFLARKLNAYSEFGKKLDGLSDKLFALSLVLSSVVMGNIFMIILLFLEERIVATNIISYKLGLNPCTEKIGKIKTIILFPTLILGVYAPLYKSLEYILIILFIISITLQIKCIKVYDNKLINDVKKLERKTRK